MVTADQLEFKKMRFKLAKQKATENPWKYKHCLTTYYRAAQINNEEKFVKIIKKGVFNDNLWKLLLLHDPPLTTITNLKAAIQRYQTSLLKFARSTPSLVATVTTGLETMQGKDLEFRRKTMKKIQELQRQLTPTQTASTTSKNNQSIAIEIDAMLEREDKEDEERDKEGGPKV